MTTRSPLDARWLVLVALVGCAPGEDVAATTRGLFARAPVLWPVQNGQATVRVCWLPLELGGERFPATNVAPDLTQTLPVRKAWAQEAVAHAWNALTPVQFVGWQDCDGSPADVRLRPISSAYKPPACAGSPGQSCAEAFGTDLQQGALAVNLNLLFGDEVLYSSRYQQSAPGKEYDSKLDLPYWWLPQACMVELRRPWSTNNTVTSHKVDIDDPAVLAQFQALYENCLKYNVLHELGHAAGFAHEQYRPDDAQKQADCYAYETSAGLKDDQPSQIATRYRGTLPLGPFDTESIMSYCRRDHSATLSPGDIAMTAVAYGPAADGGADVAPVTDVGPPDAESTDLAPDAAMPVDLTRDLGSPLAADAAPVADDTITASDATAPPHAAAGGGCALTPSPARGPGLALVAILMLLRSSRRRR